MTTSNDNSKSTKILQDAVDSSIQHYQAVENFLDEHADELAPENARRIREKNIHLKHSIQGLQAEIKNETTP
ncbi:small acid-soluble spore protein Tlp [Paenibacillus guangzhouensis]|uniref:small acid-soluble spore protein Tlp n=1 Tax=Paenibacillus guangzhouensis TaxID=1473112 RepID=UPI001266CA80|nr:small acid-soluble spore protein Tlp [Paenibacillus guangzhouensis]